MESSEHTKTRIVTLRPSKWAAGAAAMLLSASLLLSACQPTGTGTTPGATDAGGAATEEVTEEAGGEVTEEATEAVTEEATGEATEEATGEATEEATGEATEEATGEATEEATEEAGTPEAGATETMTGTEGIEATETVTE